MGLAPHTGCDGSPALTLFSWVENVGPKTLQGGEVPRSHMWEHSPGGGHGLWVAGSWLWAWGDVVAGPCGPDSRGAMSRAGCAALSRAVPPTLLTCLCFLGSTGHEKLTYWEWPPC